MSNPVPQSSAARLIRPRRRPRTCAVARLPPPGRDHRGPSGPSLLFTAQSALLAGPHGSVIWARAAIPKRPHRGGTDVSRALPLAGPRRPSRSPVIRHDRDAQGSARPAGGLAGCFPGRTARPASPTSAPRRESPTASTSYVYPEFNTWPPAAAYAIASTDYEGLGTPGVHPYLIGKSEGARRDRHRGAPHGALDSRRRQALGSSPAHSQGGPPRRSGGAALGPSWGARSCPFRGRSRRSRRPSARRRFRRRLLANLNSVRGLTGSRRADSWRAPPSPIRAINPTGVGLGPSLGR